MAFELDIDYELDYIVIGLVSNLKEYKLAWVVNNSLNINLIKQKDVQIETISNKNLRISYLKFNSENNSLKLLRNRPHETKKNISLYVLPELKEFDYFILVDSENQANEISTLLNKSNFIEFASKIDVDQLKNKENLIFE